jgi:glycosyltransferase involved in cell wall biosynthesis
MAVYRTIAEQASYLRLHGHQVDVLTRDDLGNPALARLDPLLLPLALITRRLAAYDLVIFHSFLGWAFHAFRRMLDPRHRVATITWYHGLEPLYHRALSEEHRRSGQKLSARFRALHHGLMPRLLKASSRASDAVFCLNRDEATYLVTHRWSELERVCRVSNGVEPGCFMTRQHRDRARRLLFVGQWLPMKGVHYLVEAFSSLAADSDLELACVGTGASANSVRSAFPDAVRSRVMVCPQVDRAELQHQLRQADLFVFPSLSEGSSCALLEAMAAQLPIIATPVGTATELLQDGRNGRLVPCANSGALARSIAELIGVVRERKRLGAAAGSVASFFTSESVWADFATKVAHVVDRHRALSVHEAPAHSDAA